MPVDLFIGSPLASSFCKHRLSSFAPLLHHLLETLAQRRQGRREDAELTLMNTQNIERLEATNGRVARRLIKQSHLTEIFPRPK